MFAFIEHGQPHNRHGGENTITLSHASVRRPCQKLTKSLTSQVRGSKNIYTLGRRSLRPSQRHRNPTLQIVAVKYGLQGPKSRKTVRISPQLRWGAGRHRFPLLRTLTKMALVPKGTRAIHLSYGAGDGNRTRVISLEGWGSTIELRPQDMVGTTGFEPATSCSQSRRATKLRHVPKVLSS